MRQSGKAFHFSECALRPSRLQSKGRRQGKIFLIVIAQESRPVQSKRLKRSIVRISPSYPEQVRAVALKKFSRRSPFPEVPALTIEKDRSPGDFKDLLFGLILVSFIQIAL